MGTNLAPAGRPRHGWRRLLIAIAVLAVVAVTAEIALRLVIPRVIEQVVRDSLEVPEDQPVEVSLGGSALLHAITGRVGGVEIDIREFSLLDGVTASATLTADSLPFNPSSGTMRGGRATLTLQGDQLDPVIELVTRGVAESGSVHDGELEVSRDVIVLGITVPVTANVALGIEDGAVTVEPTGLGAAGFDLSAAQLSAATGSLLEPLLTSHTVCVADRLPRGVTLTEIELSTPDTVSVIAELSPGLFSESSEQENGTCE